MSAVVHNTYEEALPEMLQTLQWDVKIAILNALVVTGVECLSFMKMANDVWLH